MGTVCRAYLVVQLVKNPPAMQENLGLIPGLGRSPGEGKGYPLQYYGLENSMDYSPWISKDLDATERLSHARVCKHDMIFTPMISLLINWLWVSQNDYPGWWSDESLNEVFGPSWKKRFQLTERQWNPPVDPEEANYVLGEQPTLLVPGGDL